MGLIEHLRFGLERTWQALARWVVPQVLYEMDLSHSAPRFSCEVCDIYWDLLLGEGWEEGERPQGTTLTSSLFDSESPVSWEHRAPGTQGEQS